VAAVAEGLPLGPGSKELLVEQIVQLRIAGRLDAAKATVAILARHDSAHPLLRRLRAELAEANGDLETALSLYAADAAAFPLDVTRHQRWVLCLRQLGQHDKALAALADGLTLAPASKELLTEHVVQLRINGRLDAAEAAIETLATQDPTSPQLPRLRAMVAEARGDLETALILYTADAMAIPHNETLRRRWVRCLRRLGREGRAAAVFAEGLALGPASKELLVEQVVQLRAARRLHAAKATVAILARYYSAHPQLPRLRAAVAEDDGDPLTALDLYAADAIAVPLDVGRRLRWVRCLGRMRSREDALTALTEGLVLVPDSDELLVEQAVQLRLSGQLDAAEAVIQALATQDPTHPQLPRLRAEVAEARGDPDAALAIYAADAMAFPRHATRRRRWIRCLWKSGQGEEALRLLDESSSRMPQLRQERVACLVDLARWEALADHLDEWSQTEQALSADLLSARMTLALNKFDYAAAKTYGDETLKLAPHHSGAAGGRVRAAVGLFEADSAWDALLRVPIASPDGGPKRRGAGRHRNLFGQIANELRLRAKATEELAVAARLNDDALVHVAANQVRADPESFGAALGLLLGLARLDRLRPPATSAGTNRTIPKVLHQFWDDKAPPSDVARLMSRAESINRTLQYTRWDNQSAITFLRGCPNKISHHAYRAARHTAMKVDIFRLALLFYEGGVYLDADDFCNTTIENLLKGDAELVFQQEDCGSIGNNFIAARPLHPMIGAALAEAAKATLTGAAESVWLVTGPGLLTRVLASAIALESELRAPRGVHVLPQSEFRQVIRPGRRASYKTTRRHWSRAA
jgi:tetratricopeptide (TPR) repeat protein